MSLETVGWLCGGGLLVIGLLLAAIAYSNAEYRNAGLPPDEPPGYDRESEAE